MARGQCYHTQAQFSDPEATKRKNKEVKMSEEGRTDTDMLRLFSLLDRMQKMNFFTDL